MVHPEETGFETDLHIGIKPTSWQYPDFVTPEKEEVTEHTLLYDDAYSTGMGKEIVLEGVYIWYAKFFVLKENPVLVHSAGPHVQMVFCLQSVTTYFSENASKPFVKFKPQQHNLFLLPQRDMFVHWKKAAETEIFAINLGLDFFFNNLPVTHPLYKHFQKGIENVMPAFMSWRNLPVTSKMISTLFEILNCSYIGYHKSLFIKAKVIELLALQFEQYEQLPVPDIASALKESDIEKMHMARQIISENLEKNWSLRDLAHLVGTNEFSLKKYFKEVFGKTVFSYLHDLRMEASMEMLQQPGNKIADISQKTGYKNPTHFTAAFKKYFGILPNKVRAGLFNLIHFGAYLMRMCCESIEAGTALETI